MSIFDAAVDSELSFSSTIPDVGYSAAVSSAGANSFWDNAIQNVVNLFDSGAAVYNAVVQKTTAKTQQANAAAAVAAAQPPTVLGIKQTTTTVIIEVVVAGLIVLMLLKRR